MDQLLYREHEQLKWNHRHVCERYEKVQIIMAVDMSRDQKVASSENITLGR